VRAAAAYEIFARLRWLRGEQARDRRPVPPEEWSTGGGALLDIATALDAAFEAVAGAVRAVAEAELAEASDGGALAEPAEAAAELADAAFRSTAAVADLSRGLASALPRRWTASPRHATALSCLRGCLVREAEALKQRLEALAADLRRARSAEGGSAGGYLAGLDPGVASVLHALDGAAE